MAKVRINKRIKPSTGRVLRLPGGFIGDWTNPTNPIGCESVKQLGYEFVKQLDVWLPTCHT